MRIWDGGIIYCRNIINSTVASTVITTGGYRVISSGIVTAFEEEPIKVKIQFEDGDHLDLVFDIKRDDGESRMEPDILDEDEIKLNLYNHEGNFEGPATPIDAGEIDGREFRIIWQVHRKPGKQADTQILSYTCYLEGEEDI